MADFFLKTDDLAPKIEVTLRDDDGTAVDLTEADSASFRMARHDTGELVIDAAGTIDADPLSGRILYAWASGDTTEPGDYDGEFTVVWGDQAVTPGPQTYPSKGYVRIRISSRLPLA